MYLALNRKCLFSVLLSIMILDIRPLVLNLAPYSQAHKHAMLPARSITMLKQCLGAQDSVSRMTIFLSIFKSVFYQFVG